MGRLEALNAATIVETLAYLAHRPYDNVFVAWLIATGQHARGHVVLWRDDAGAVAGVCYYGVQIVPFSHDPDALDAFAERSRNARDARMLVGPRPMLERFWRGARGWFPIPRAKRTSQPVYAIDRAALRTIVPHETDDAAWATSDELDELVPHSARMIAAEIGGDFATMESPQFRERCERIVKAGWWWRFRVDGKIVFTCNLGSATPATAQIQGVWTPPEFRGAGYARRGLAALCAAALGERPSLCLYVNDFNTRAIALYECVGFARVGEFQTIIMP